MDLLVECLCFSSLTWTCSKLGPSQARLSKHESSWKGIQWQNNPQTLPECCQTHVEVCFCNIDSGINGPQLLRNEASRQLTSLYVLKSSHFELKRLIPVLTFLSYLKWEHSPREQSQHSFQNHFLTLVCINPLNKLLIILNAYLHQRLEQHNLNHPGSLGAGGGAKRTQVK